MSDLVLAVDDNHDILFNLKLTLELNGYRVITANNGEEGLDVLSKSHEIPSLILSDIMMPEMNGYDFFKETAQNHEWSQIPFIFLSARASEKDVRFGKMLGVDDYITKPFKTENLLAIMAGKITRNKVMKRALEDKLATFNLEMKASLASDEKSKVIFMLVLWNETMGPVVQEFFTKEQDPNFNPDKIGTQLFSTVVSMYSQDGPTSPQGILLNIENIKKTGYLYFDSMVDQSVRKGFRRFMLAVLAPRISYFESLKIKELLHALSTKITKKAEWNPEDYWNKTVKILSTSFLN
ncbi:MAG: response regulator [Candidatus Ranarchaeia archaeon]